MTETRTLVLEHDMPHAPEKVWRALTTQALIADWLLANDFEPVIGHRFQLRAPPMPQWNGLVDCEVLEIDEPRRLSYRWDVGDAAKGGMATVVTFTLEPTDGGCRLRMEQSGFRPDQEHNLRGAEFGWTRFLGGLERVAGKQA